MVLESNDPGGGVFALFLVPTLGHLDSLFVPTPGNLPFLKKKKKKEANGWVLAGWGEGRVVHYPSLCLFGSKFCDGLVIFVGWKFPTCQV